MTRPYFAIAFAAAVACSSAASPTRSNACSAEESTLVAQYTQQYGQPIQIVHPLPTSDAYVFSAGTDAISHVPVTVTLSFDWSSGSCIAEANGQPVSG